MLTEREEILIQRCVDGELSAEERRELLTRLEALPDGWKTLACSFMEEQLFADAVTEAAGRSMRPVAQTATPVAAHKRHWFNHPVTSVALSVCVAFLAGLLVSGELNQTGSNPGVNMTATETPDDAAENNSAGGVSGRLVSDQPNYSVRFEADGTSHREMPVYSDETDFLTELDFHRRQMRERTNQAPGPAEIQSSDIHFLRIKMEDGRVIVVPFEGALPKFQ